MRVALFITCYNDRLFPDDGIATTRLLERLGHTVQFPEAQTCCGQMHYNTGYQRESIPLVRHFVEVFGDAEVVVAPSASCVGMVRELYPKAAALSGDERLITAVRDLVTRVDELGEFLVVHRHGMENVRSDPNSTVEPGIAEYSCSDSGCWRSRSPCTKTMCRGRTVAALRTSPVWSA